MKHGGYRENILVVDFDQIQNWLLLFGSPHTIYALIFGILMLCGFGLPIPEDVTLITGGYLAFLGRVDVHLVLVVSFLGVMFGDSTMFMLGHRYGSAFLRHRFLARFITEKKIAKARERMNRYGDKIFFLARFLPGLRTPIFFTGGSLHTRFRTFFFYDFTAALISVPVWVYLAYFGGSYINQVLYYGKRAQFAVIILLVLVVAGKIWWSVRKRRRAAVEN